MAGMSDYLEAEVLDHILTLGPFYVGLHTSDPEDDNSGTECTGTPYARQLVTLTRSSSVLSNSGLISFPESTDSWGTLTHIAVYDAVSGGNQMFNGTLAYSKVVNALEVLTFPVGTLTFTLD